MSLTQQPVGVSVEDALNLFNTAYWAYANGALLVFELLLCLEEEVRFIWNRDPKVTGPVLVYAFSRYGVLAKSLLIIATNYPMSELGCTTDVWAQTVAGILGKMSFSVFCALRAYALSNRNKWHRSGLYLLSPFNCSASSSLSPMFSLSVSAIGRGSQLAAELLVIGVTWRYTYSSYQKGIKMGKTVSSRLVYNGCLYFLSLAIIYALNIILKIALASAIMPNVDTPFDVISDSVTSILICRFMLSLRQVNGTNVPATLSVPRSPVCESKAKVSGVLEIGARPSYSLPPFLASFAHPLHVDSDLSEADSDATLGGGSEWEEAGQPRLTLTTLTPSSHDSRLSPGRQTSEAEECCA